MNVNYFCPHYGICRTPLYTGRCRDDCMNKNHKPKKDEKVFFVVKCKNCKHRRTADCPMRFEKLVEDNDSHGFPIVKTVIIDKTTHDGFCHVGEK